MTTPPDTGRWQRHFGEATVRWFEHAFAAPTTAQIAAWDALADGWQPGKGTPGHALVIAPTGSGKTLAAFLMSLDRLSRTPSTGKVRVLYVSPLKALAVDIEKNLRRPLAGIEQMAAELGLPAPSVRVAVRSGDTTPADRRRLVTHPPDILITTPESLFLMLSSAAATVLDAVEVVIVDEIHSLAGTKRGAHLALSLTRLDEATRRPMQRIGLSATARPAATIARFLGGERADVAVIDPPTPKQWSLSVRVPVADMTIPGPDPSPMTQKPDATNYSMWPSIEEAILDLVLAHRSTICFVNSRMVAERLTAHLNQRAAARLGIGTDETAPMPNVYAATHGVAQNFDPSDDGAGQTGLIVARAHHGSLSKERRAVIEEDLKQGRLRCVVATSSLELGIDMGFVDLVIQTGSPPSVASGLQRVGRAGHQVGVESHGVVFPTSRADLVEAAVVVRRMADGLIETVPSLSNPLDVLAQHVVSMCLDDTPTASAAFDIVRKSQPFATLPRPASDAVLDMLAGRYPSEDFAELRPRLTWDHATDRLSARPGARQLVTTSGGTIPDRGLFGVFLTTDTDEVRGSRRVGELDEEMVHETRLGDIITLGSSSWRVEAITPHQVQVSPAPGMPGRLPFWHGDAVGRPVEVGEAIGALVASIGESPELAAAELRDSGLDDAAIENLERYIADQKRATGVLPTDQTILVERFRDELGDWRVCVHAPFGTGVLRPWMLALQQTITDRYGIDARVTIRNDGVIWRLPATDSAPPGAGLMVLSPKAVDEAVSVALLGSPLFAARFRECAARALLLPRRRPGARTPLWAQRLRAGQLLQVAGNYRDFPIVLEAMRECLDDVFDMPSLRALLAGIERGTIRLVEVETATPSPFARSLQFGYAGEFIYDDDQPLAERRSAAMAIDPALLASLLSGGDSRAPIDKEAAGAVQSDLQRLRHRAGSAESLWDVLRVIGPLTTSECHDRCDGDAEGWLRDLADARRVARVGVGGRDAWVVTDDLPLLRQAADGDRQARQRLAIRWLRSHVVTTPGDLCDRHGWAANECRAILDGLVADGQAVEVLLDAAQDDRQYAISEVLAQVTRRQAIALRAATKPVDATHLAAFEAAWHGIAKPEAGLDALLQSVELLAGRPLPASMLETLVLPARVLDYHPGLLDEALAGGQVVWSSGGRLGERDCWVRLWPGDLVLTDPSTFGLDDDPAAAALWARLADGGAWRLGDLDGDDDTMWRLTWAGLVTCDTFAPVRELVKGLKRQPSVPSPRRVTAWRTLRPATAPAGGRWSALRPTTTDATTRWAQSVEVAAGRHGVLTRGAVLSESMNYSTAYQVLKAMEERGLLRRGYFVAGAGPAQFALPGAVDMLRAVPSDDVVLLAAVDPANPYGEAVPWPPTRAHQPSRRAGAIVVTRAGRPVCFIEPGARSLVTFSDAGDEDLAAALTAIGRFVDDNRIGPVSLNRIDDRPTVADRDRADLMRHAGFQPTPQGFVRRPN